jgi:uncharacterized delta-60 repeat protein
MVIERFSSSGQFDSSFGYRTFGSQGDGRGISVLSDGTIVAGGSGMTGSRRGLLLVELDPQGNPIPSFGSSGVVLATLSNFTYSIALNLLPTSDGRFVLPGQVALDAGVQNGPGEMMVAKFLSNGTLDSTFGDGGFAVTDVGGVGGDSIAWNGLLQPDGKVVAIGAYTDSFDHFAVIRYLPNGLIDLGFGAQGKVVNVFSSGSDSHALGGGVEVDGRLVVSGNFNLGSHYDLAVARFWP